MNREQLILYAITDSSENDTAKLLQKTEQALAAGVSILQLREKELDDEAFIKKAKAIKKICEKYSVPLIINDRPEVALKSGADGVHVGIEDMPVRKIRQMAGEDFIIGATAKTVEQAEKAEAEGADYIGVGAVFPSPTKKNAIRITKEQLKEITSSVSIPAVAIGGITLENAWEIKDTGVCGIAVVSAIFAAEDIPEACIQLKKAAVAASGRI